MAKTAAIALSASTCTAEQRVTATCTVTNSDAGAVNVVGIRPKAVVSGGTTESVAVALGLPPIGPGYSTSVAGSGGTLAISFDVVPHAPASGYGLAEPASQAYDIGAIINLSDGTTITATTATLTASNPSH